MTSYTVMRSDQRRSIPPGGGQPAKRGASCPEARKASNPEVAGARVREPGGHVLGRHGSRNPILNQTQSLGEERPYAGRMFRKQRFESGRNTYQTSVYD
eukprot:4241600-Amphidinium_carterae.1